MIRFLFRFFGLLFLAAGFILLIYDGTKSIAGNRLFLTSVRTLWELINAGSLEKIKPMIESYAGGFLWDPLMVTFFGGSELERARRFRHHFPSTRPQEKTADRLRAALVPPGRVNRLFRVLAYT